VATESTHKRRRGVTIRVIHGPAVMTEADVRTVEDLLVRFAMRRFVREHPTMFGKEPSRESTGVSGPPAAAAAVVGVLPADAGGPVAESGERDDGMFPGSPQKLV
jgi:hypothetical protein